MNEYLFRGKRTDVDRWITGQYIHLHKSTYCIGPEPDDNGIHQIVFEEMTDWGLPNRYLRADVDPRTVGQYIGRRDINGKQIFEGDLVTIPGSRRAGLPAPVKYYAPNCAFVLAREGYNYILFSDEDDTPYEVVGNIYDGLSKDRKE